MKRMEGLKRMIPKNAVLADIGTDHAYLPILAVSDHTIEKAYACDVAPGPLSQAKENIEKAGLQDRISVILSNGFENVPMDVSAAVIAGMGYYTAAEILERAEKRLGLLTDIIVQVNQDVPLLRRWISDRKYRIKKELSLKERGKYYTIIDFDTRTSNTYPEEAILCGDPDVHLDLPAWKEELLFRIEKTEEIIAKRGGDEALEKECRLRRNALQSLAGNPNQ
ncbi:MAG: SAM-dependent methyltransferase [Solobacterium sp.]|nr:SAM-dependent methyltransferase [Solobacterium sp.]